MGTYQATKGKPIEFVNGHPKFENFAPVYNGKPAIVTIQQLGNHNKGPNGDFGKAVIEYRKIIGDPNWKPDYSKYTWHHHENGATMVLIDRRIHNVSEGGLAHVGDVSNNPNL